MHNFTIRRLYMPVWVFTSTMTTPSGPGWSPTIQPRIHLFLGRLLSTTITTSFILTDLFREVHFVLLMGVGKYACTQRCQNWLARAWLALHCFLRHTSNLLNWPGGRAALLVPIRKWLGIRASSSALSNEMCKWATVEDVLRFDKQGVQGLLFRVLFL